jgi:hypothetical protein
MALLYNVTKKTELLCTLMYNEVTPQCMLIKKLALLMQMLQCLMVLCEMNQWEKYCKHTNVVSCINE